MLILDLFIVHIDIVMVKNLLPKQVFVVTGTLLNILHIGRNFSQSPEKKSQVEKIFFKYKQNIKQKSGKYLS